MEKIDKIFMNTSINCILEKYIGKDFLGNGNEKEDDYKLYSNRTIKNLLELIKIGRMYDKGVIDDKEKEELENKLNKYYDLKDRIADIVYTCLISDMDECDDMVVSYYDRLGDLYRDIDRYNVFIDIDNDRIMDFLIGDIDKNISKKGKKYRLKR